MGCTLLQNLGLLMRDPLDNVSALDELGTTAQDAATIVM